MDKQVGPYKIIEELSSGGFGRVYKAKHQQSQAMHAVKVMHKTSDIDKKRFMQEVSSLAQLDHPDIVKVYDYSVDDNQPWMSMEYIEGKTLNKYREEQGITPRQSAKMSYMFLNILEYVHEKGLIHRDIKPENIMITEDGRMKLTDFGIAKSSHYSSDELTKSHELLGTLYYMSPEQTKRSKDVDERSDIYSIGAVLYFMMTGNSPHAGVNQFDSLRKILSGSIQSPREINKTIPRSLESICYKALALEVEERYQSCEEFKYDLKKFLVNEKVSVASRRVDDLRRLFRKYKKRIIGAGVVGIGVFTGIYGIVQHDLNILERINADLKIQQAETIVLLNQLEEQSIKINADRELIRIHENTDDNKFILNVNEENVLELYEKCSNKSLGAYITGKYYESFIQGVKRDNYFGYGSKKFFAKALYSYLRSFELDENNIMAKNKIMKFIEYERYTTNVYIKSSNKSPKFLSSDFFIVWNSYPNLFKTNQYVYEQCKKLAKLIPRNEDGYLAGGEMKKLALDETKLDDSFPSMVLLGLHYSSVKKNNKGSIYLKKAAEKSPYPMSLFPLISDAIISEINRSRLLSFRKSVDNFLIFGYNEGLDYLERYLKIFAFERSHISWQLTQSYISTCESKITYYIDIEDNLKAEKLAKEIFDLVESYVKNYPSRIRDRINIAYYATYYEHVVKVYEEMKNNSIANQTIFRKLGDNPKSILSTYALFHKIYDSYQVLKNDKHLLYKINNEEDFLRRCVEYGEKVKIKIGEKEKRSDKDGLVNKFAEVLFEQKHYKYVQLYNEIRKR